MTGRTESKPSRPPLSRHRVLHAAVAVADQGGLDSLTMRRLGESLGVEAMSLYKHVVSKEEILDGIIDIVVGEIELPSPGDDWRAAMRQRANSARHVLASHPWAIGMLESRNAMGPLALKYTDAVIGSLRSGGFSVEMAAHAFWLLDSYIYGFVVQELSMPFSTDEDAAHRDALQTLPATEYPHLVEMASEFIAGTDHYATEFEFGLDLILDGLEKHRR